MYIIQDIETIWKTLSSGYAIIPSEFGDFCDSFMEKFNNDVRVNWYEFSPTLHKILVHGRECIEFFPVPIGWLSEEPAEANNKYFRQFRQFHARKSSRQNNLRDIFTRTAAMSDPLFLDHYFKIKRNLRVRSPSIPPKVLKMLKPVGPDEMS